MIRKCTDDDCPALYGIINDAAQVYKGVIPDDRYHEPYMPIRAEARNPQWCSVLGI
jgi:hypothetical protein